MKTIIVFLIIIISFLFCGCPSIEIPQTTYNLGSWNMQDDTFKYVQTNLNYLDSIITGCNVIIYSDEGVICNYDGSYGWVYDNGLVTMCVFHSDDSIFNSNSFNNTDINRGEIQIILK